MTPAEPHPEPAQDGPAECPLGLGVVGAGGFGTFVGDAAAQLPDLRVVAVTDEDPARAERLAVSTGAAVAADLTTLLADPAVQAVVIATPPSTHAALAVSALNAGRHVFSEKPMALSLEDTRRVSTAARTSGCAYVVDHVIRYNPIIVAVQRLRDEGLVGQLQRFSFENDAADEFLPAEHWFWDPELSGGILLEHGVHFFDVAAALADAPAAEVQTMGYRRADGRVDTVVATVRHSNGVLATHAHGFSHASRAERQLMRLDCGLTQLRIHGWIPLLAEIDGWVDDQAAQEYERLPARLHQLLDVPGGRLQGTETVTVRVQRDAAEAATHSRDQDFRAPHRVTATIDLGGPAAHLRVYSESVRAALSDLATCARTGGQPRAGVEAGAAAVRVAVAGTRALETGTTVQVRV
ncbi:hypothetical protein GCM10009841_28090 [Microlunatus panaciterrae]|uniref:Dehydrogenase n=1 Tax=Microlunatus panaciterrae TaxID=400768 RepID=A0ABS2RFF1_9ACTN|nr:Gfo/Idh/MocA family oxidoreductase [Microlunatus panaciterrae]MBM7797468.1 putative dehydrogenase [Microlunatus panaciterrae]